MPANVPTAHRRTRRPARRRKPHLPLDLFQVAAVKPVNVFSTEELQRARERLTQGDGLHHLLARIGGEETRDASVPLPASLTAPGFMRRHLASFATIAIYLFLAVIPGLMISLSAHRGDDDSFVRLTDWRELPGALVLYLLLAPVIWTFYLWQPRLILEVFDGLARSGAIGPARGAGVTADEVLRKIGASFIDLTVSVRSWRITRGSLLAVLSVGVAISTLLIWPPTAPAPFDRLLPESDRYWWRTVPLYFWCVWLPLVFINVYMLVWIVIRQTVMIANIQRLLRLFDVEPIPFHPDGSNGFAPIGNYAVTIVRVALVIGGWALVLLLSGPVTGHGLYVAPHTLFLVFVQVLLTPYLLLGPVWYAHRVMQSAQERALQRVGDSIRTLLLGNASGSIPTGRRIGPYQELEARYRLVEEGYKTWPFRRTTLSGVSITAGVTLIANIAAILYRMVANS